MALLIAPLFTAGITVGGIQNANAGNGIECEFTKGGTAEVTLSLGEESGDISKEVECDQENNGPSDLEIEDVRDVTVVSCTDNLPTSTITATLSSLTVGFTAAWTETITLESAPGVASFMCNIRFLVDTFSGNVSVLQTVTINFVPPSIPIGGTVGSMDTVSLLVAGAQANIGWGIIALVGVGAGVGIAYKAKTNKTHKETL